MIVILDNFDERTHNLREEDNTDEHEENSNEHLGYRDWEVVTISDGRKSGKGEVAYDNGLSIGVLGTFAFFSVFSPFFRQAVFGECCIVVYL